MPTARDHIEATCPCGASLLVEASAKACAERLDEFNKAHLGHVKPVAYPVYPYVQPAPYPVYPRYDRWYGPVWTTSTSGRIEITSAQTTNGVQYDSTGRAVTVGCIQN